MSPARRQLGAVPMEADAPRLATLLAGGRGQRLLGIFAKTGIADNAATSIFTITTTNEAGNNDGGAYSCRVQAVVGHAALAAAGDGAVKSFLAHFGRIMKGTGTGDNTVVSEINESASAATTPAQRDVGAVTMTVVETTEYVQTVQFTIDLTGAAVATAEVAVFVDLVWTGFLTPPAMAQA